MKKEKSKTRKQYEYVYRLIRIEGDEEEQVPKVGVPNNIIQAAEYSYQARDYKVHGWSRGLNQLRFNHIIWRILSREEQIN